MRPIAPFSPRPAASPSSSTSSASTGSVHRERERLPRTPLPSMAPAPAPSPVYPVPRTPMCDARRYRSLFPRRRVAPPTPPPTPPPPSDDEPSVKTYDLATELVGDPDEPYVAEHVPYGAPEAYYSDASYGSECESASTDTALLAIIPLVVLPAVCPWAMGLPPAGLPVTVIWCDHDIPKVGMLHGPSRRVMLTHEVAIK
ncbi:hypothetical protein PIB30_075203 [Stylosanthes scabra]|uniref:Uncharacterized protein n=1 Tax=Stylosanthes scabra TaxID=79078 RepID=A0ABU6QPG6_9FABA|nr:hypothetical protein [Stylosanthes scabra]